MATMEMARVVSKQLAERYRYEDWFRFVGVSADEPYGADDWFVRFGVGVDSCELPDDVPGEVDGVLVVFVVRQSRAVAFGGGALEQEDK